MAHRAPPFIRLPCGRLEGSIRILWLNGLREGDDTIKEEKKKKMLPPFFLFTTLCCVFLRTSLLPFSYLLLHSLPSLPPSSLHLYSPSNISFSFPPYSNPQHYLLKNHCQFQCAKQLCTGNGSQNKISII